MIEARTADMPTPDVLAAGRGMVEEAHHVIDRGQEIGVPLRLIGGLAVHEHCRELSFCERDYSDIDLVGRRRDSAAMVALFRDLGYQENHDVRFATRGRQLQFSRPCRHPDATLQSFVHPDDHVDVFLDTFLMDHEIPLADRLEIERYTISLTDVLLTKLQTTRLNDKDVLDIVVLLKDVPLGADDTPGVVNASHIAELAAADWGLYRDVTVALAAASAALTAYELSAAERERVAAAVETLSAAIETAPKSRGWRRRAKLGERRPWSNAVEGQDGS